MKIAIIGPGAIGSTFAFQLAAAGHEVTVVARNERLAYLQREGAIVMEDGRRATVDVAAALDTHVAYDLLLVGVLEHQVEAILPDITASASTSIMFMFNTFDSLERLKAAVGEARFGFGFPAILATIDRGVLTSRILSFPQITKVTDPIWAAVFAGAGIPTVVETEMHAWLRTHAALMVPFMVLSKVAHARGGGVTWHEAQHYARGLREGFDIVKSLKTTVTPPSLNVVAVLPSAMVALLFWGLSRSKVVQNLGAKGASEPRALIDAMSRAALGKTPILSSMRP